MQRERLSLALERIQPTQWKHFEEFASEFLSTHYSKLRTVASPSGDQGRDAELFSPEGQTHVVLQYSVTKQWKTKIRDTVERVSKTIPDARVLIYVTNQSILAAADELKREILDEHGIVLDIHDCEWFLDRFRGHEHKEAVSEHLAKIIVDPYLASREVIEHGAPALSSGEYQAALTFLQLQWEDDTREKGLTRLSFEALVRTALRGTTSESRVTRSTVHDRVRAMLPDHDSTRVISLTDSALRRLTKRHIRHWPKCDEFCLTYEESERVRDRLAAIELANAAVDRELRGELESATAGMEGSVPELDVLSDTAGEALNHYLLRRGEAFAVAVANNRVETLSLEGLEDSIISAVAERLEQSDKEHRRIARQSIFVAIRELLVEPSPEVQRQLRSKADAYTLFAFLEQTPDVQEVVSKVFSHGTIWLDTTIVLPLLAEDLISDDQRRFTQMLAAASGAGLKLRVTSGVLEEVERHINRCVTYARHGEADWRGRIPFLADAYLRSGRSIGTFASWIEQFEGQERPEDDLAEYFSEYFAIEREDLESDVENVNERIRVAVQEAWHEAHARRRDSMSAEMDESTVQRLVRHDVENYLGVGERRRRESSSPLGYSAWWLTLDHVAFGVEANIREKLGVDTPPSPVMSADFLVNYLSVGPIRSRISKDTESILPVALDIGFDEDLPSELLEEAEKIRQESGDLPEHVIRRRVRDHLDKAKRRTGKMVVEGVEGVLSAIDKTQ